MLVLLLLACSPGPAPARPAQRLAIDPSVDLGTALESCLALEAPDAAGLCALDAMELRHSVSPQRCARLPPSIWRDECFFVASEVSSRPLDERYAICEQAGRFEDDCRFHLWQLDLQALRKTPTRDPSIVQSARAVHARHRPSQGKGTADFDERFWDWFWRDYWRAQPALDPAWCADLVAQEDREACEAALPGAIRSMRRDQGP